LPGPLATSLFQLGRELLGVEAPMTRFIVALELGVFALCIISNPLGFVRSFTAGGLLHGLFSNFEADTLIRFGALAGPLGEHQPWRMLSAVFVHMGILHIGMNLYTFVDLGRMLERALGGARFAILFVLAGFLGFLASELWYGFYGPVTAGASGGVFGQIGAVVGILYARRDPEWKRALMRCLFFAVLLGLALPVNTPAHLGGFFAGIVLGFLLYKEQMRLHLHRVTAILAGICLLASALSVTLSAVWFAAETRRASATQRE
jgi:membrane associated rhomboid family serine protease